MRTSDASPGVQHVACGPTAEDAAAAFGVEHDDLILTSYDELAAEVDLDQVGSLDLAAGEGLYQTLDLACGQLHADRGFALRVEYSVGTAALLEDALARNSVLIADVQGRDERLLLVLESAHGPSDPGTHVTLAALEAAHVALSAAPRADRGPASHPDEIGTSSGSGEEAPARTTTPVPVVSGAQRTHRQGRRRPRLLQLLQTVNRWRSSRRRRAAIVVAVSALALVVLTPLLLSGASRPVVAISLTLLLVLGVGATGLVVMVVLLLARQVHNQTGRIERMLLRSRTLSEGRMTDVARHVRASAELQARLPHMHDFLQAMAAASSSSAARLSDQIESVESGAAELHLDTQRQVQALLNLHQLVDIRDRVAPMGGWAASADFNVLMLQELISTRPRTVVECGSGTSTLLLALAVRQYGLPSRVVALEHLAMFKAATERALHLHGVAGYAEVRLAPLSRVSVPDHETPWYREESWRDLADIGLLVVDGPPATTGDRARYPAVPLLRDRMAAACTIVVDDLIRHSDLEVARSWRELLPDFDFEQQNVLQKHVGVFRRPISRPDPG